MSTLAADGVPVRGRRSTYDAFWGARYAVVSDPDGNGVGIIDPVDPAGATRHRERSPDDAIDVVIEIPTGSRNKYEYDHEMHVIRLDRRLFTATTYPADYGFVPTPWTVTAIHSTRWCSWPTPPSPVVSCGRASSACSP